MSILDIVLSVFFFRYHDLNPANFLRPNSKGVKEVALESAASEAISCKALLNSSRRRRVLTNVLTKG